MSADVIDSILRNCTRREPASDMAIAQLQKSIGFCLPAAYQSLMSRSNGCEGFVADDLFLVLWPVEQIYDLNNAYGVREFAPGLVFFGSDGGQMGFAFDSRSAELPVVEVPFIGMSLDDAKQRGRCFEEFLKNLQSN